MPDLNARRRTAKILDFGIARIDGVANEQVERVTMTAHESGHDHRHRCLHEPEQVRGVNVDAVGRSYLTSGRL
jgi:hypothetical protein